MMPYVSRMSAIRVSPNSAVAASESCSGIRHKLMSRCERSLVGRGEKTGGEVSGTTLLDGERRCYRHRANFQRYVMKTCAQPADTSALDGAFNIGTQFAARTLRCPSWLLHSYHANSF